MGEGTRKSKIKNGIFTFFCAVCACAIIGGLISLTNSTVNNMRKNTEFAIAQAVTPTQIETPIKDEETEVPDTTEELLIETGEQEVVSMSTPEPSTYDIEWGDTLSGISRETGISVESLAHANEIADVDFIYAGSTIVVPEYTPEVETQDTTEEVPEKTVEETAEESVETPAAETVE